LQHGGPKRGCSLEQVASLLERLSNADIAQQLEDGALGIGHERCVRFALEMRKSEACIRLFVEPPLSVVAAWETFGEPGRQRRRRRTVIVPLVRPSRRSLPSPLRLARDFPPSAFVCITWAPFEWDPIRAHPDADSGDLGRMT
jgi:hypothetical protein